MLITSEEGTTNNKNIIILNILSLNILYKSEIMQFFYEISV